MKELLKEVLKSFGINLPFKEQFPDFYSENYRIPYIHILSDTRISRIQNVYIKKRMVMKIKYMPCHRETYRKPKLRKSRIPIE